MRCSHAIAALYEETGYRGSSSCQWKICECMVNTMSHNPSTFQISITTKPTTEKAKMLMTNKATPYRPMVYLPYL